MNGVNFLDPMGEKLYISGDLTLAKKYLLEIVQGGKTDSGNSFKSSPVGCMFGIQGVEQVDSVQNNNSDLGAALIKLMIDSPKKFLFGIGTTYPSRYNLGTKYRSSGLGGYLVNNDSNIDYRGNYDNFPTTKRLEKNLLQNGMFHFDSYKYDYMLPPSGVDSLVYFNPSILSEFRASRPGVITVHYGTGGQPIMPKSDFFFIVFHELAEAYYKVHEGRQYSTYYVPRNGMPGHFTSGQLEKSLSSSEIEKYFIKVIGAHDKARKYEQRWRGKLRLRTDIFGANPQLKEVE